MFIGFDYGTANCSVAVMRDHGPELLTLENNEPYLPSMLCAPTREAVSECLHRHWQVPTGSEENQQLLRRAISYNREEDIPVGGDSVLFGLQALAHYMEDPEEVYFVRSPKSFLGANGLKPQQIALFEDCLRHDVPHQTPCGKRAAGRYRSGGDRPTDQLPWHRRRRGQPAGAGHFAARRRTRRFQRD